jgi:hypothetical protein
MRERTPGQDFYEPLRAAMNAAHRRRASSCREPRWKDLKPWLKRAYEEAVAAYARGDA